MSAREAASNGYDHGTINCDFRTVPNGTLRSERLRPAIPRPPFRQGTWPLRQPPTTGALARSHSLGHGFARRGVVALLQRSSRGKPGRV